MADREPLRVDIGFPEFRAKFFQKYRLAIDSMGELVALGNKCTQKPVSEPLHKVIGWIACIVSNSVGAVATLVFNGYGNDAMKIARSMFEASVTASYLKRHPDQITDYLDYHWIIQKRRLDYMRKFAPELLKRVSPESIVEADKRYSDVVDRFNTKRGQVRGRWSRASLREMAKEIGREPLYLTFYSWASSMQHLDFAGLSSQTETSLEGKDAAIFCDVAPSENWIETALLTAHGSALLVIDNYNEVAKLGMEQEIQSANEAFTKAWQKAKP